MRRRQATPKRVEGFTREMPTNLAELRGRVARQRNRAVFEVVDLLARQLGEEPAEDEDRQVA